MKSEATVLQLLSWLPLFVTREGGNPVTLFRP